MARIHIDEHFGGHYDSHPESLLDVTRHRRHFRVKMTIVYQAVAVDQCQLLRVYKSGAIGVPPGRHLPATWCSHYDMRSSNRSFLAAGLQVLELPRTACFNNGSDSSDEQ